MFQKTFWHGNSCGVTSKLIVNYVFDCLLRCNVSPVASVWLNQSVLEGELFEKTRMRSFWERRHWRGKDLKLWDWGETACLVAYLCAALCLEAPSICWDAPAGTPLHLPQMTLSAPALDPKRRVSYPEDKPRRVWARRDAGNEVDGTTPSWHRNISQRLAVCRLRACLPRVVRLVRTHQFILARLSRQSITAGWNGTSKTPRPAWLYKTHTAWNYLAGTLTYKECSSQMSLNSEVIGVIGAKTHKITAPLAGNKPSVNY